MPRDGTGTAARAVADYTPNEDILSADVNAEFDDVYAELTNSLARDGQSPATADIPFGGFKATGLGAPAATDDAATKEYVDDTITAVAAYRILGSTPLATLTTSAGITIPTGYRSLRIGISPTIGGAAGNQTMSLQVMINGAWLTATAGYYAGQQVDWSNTAGFSGTNMVDTPSGIVMVAVNNSTAAAATLTLELDDVRAVSRTNHLLGSAGYNNLTNWVTRQVFGLITTPSNQRIEAVRVTNVTGGASAFATGYLHVEGLLA